MRVCLVLLTATLSSLVPGPATALGGPENVLVVQNGNSPTSCRIAAYYATRRGIPAGNLVTLSTADSSQNSSAEVVSPQDYQDLIETPIRTYLSAHGLANQIQFIVLTKGVPLVLNTGTWGGKSVDSLLSAIDLVNPLTVVLEWNNQTDTAFANRYWQAPEPFTHSSYGGYLVTRLDGYTEAEAKALVDRALAGQGAPYYLLLDVDARRGLGNPSLQPKSLLLPDGTLDPDYLMDYFDFNADLIRASQVISDRPQLSVELETTDAFVSSPYSLAGYESWGSNDGGFSATTYHSLAFATAGLAETAVSTSARTFLPTSGGQSLIADLIARGAAGAKGYVTEPFLDAVASPTVLFDLYTSGRNLAESYYAASRLIGWKDVVVGDPLCSLTGSSVQTIAEAKALPDGSLVSLPGKAVTAGTNDLGDRFYIQEQDRSSGIQVYLGKTFPGIAEGAIVSVRGLMGTRNGERAILNASLIGSVAVASRAGVAAASSSKTRVRIRATPLPRASRRRN